MQSNSIVNERALQAIYRVADLAGMPVIDPDKVRPVCLHNLINNLLEIARSYVNDDVDIPEFASYIVHHFVITSLSRINKFERKSQCSHAMYTILYSWKGLMESRMECRLLATMLQGDRSDKAAIKNYLRVRKEIIKTNPMELLDEIYLVHQETIAIVHRLYDTSRRKSICKWLNDFYINMNYRQVNNAKLQSCIFVEFLMNCYGQMTNQQLEVRLTSKDSRRENPGLFTSRIDKNNGFAIIKGKVDLNRQPYTDRFSQSKISYSKVIRSAAKQTSPAGSRAKQQRNVRSNREQLAEVQSNQLVNRLFDQNQSPQKSLSDMSPAKLFKTAQKSFQKLNKIDQQLDSRRDGHPSHHNSNHKYKHQKDNSSQQIRDNSSSNLVEKYTEDWEKMIERNQSFKQRMLRKSRVIVDKKKKLLEESSLDMREDRQHGKQLHLYERLGDPGQLSPRPIERDHYEVSQFHADKQFSTLNRNTFDNFSFKDNSDHDEHFNIQEIRESVRVKTLFK